MPRVAALAVVVLGIAGLPSASAQPSRQDYAALALNVLPPGPEREPRLQPEHERPGAALRVPDAALRPRAGRGRPALLQGRIARARRQAGARAAAAQGLVIERDRWGVPHITGKTAADVAFGAGWVTVEDRGLLLELIRGPARAAALDIPGISPVELALSGKQFVPSTQGEAELSRQLGLVREAGARGKRLLTVVQAYVAGLNASLKKRGLLFNPYTTRDVVAVAALLTARFGANGGSEIRRAMFLDALQKKLGRATGRAVFDDLRAADDGETPTIGPGRFAYQLPPAAAPGSVVIDDGSFQPAPLSGGIASQESHAASNALLVGAKRSKTGRPILVGGPQVGYFFPQFFMEVDLHGGGFDARGALLPGLPFVVIGRGPDYAWTVTSSQADNVDVFAESLCGDDRHYLHQGSCREMTSLDAGTLRSTGTPDQRLSLLQTVHGPVLGYATVGGARVALSLKRSTRGREVLSGLPILALNTGQVTSAKSFVSTAVSVEGMFNFFYVDHRDIAHATAGRLPIRSQGTDPVVAHGRHGGVRVARLPRRKGASADGEPGVRRDPRLELPPGRGLGSSGRQLVVRLRAAEGAAERGARARQEERGGGRGRFQQGGDAGPPRDGGLAGDRRRARHGPGAEPAGADRSRSPDRMACCRWQPSRPRPRREDRPRRAQPSWTPPGRSSRGPSCGRCWATS